MNSPLKYCRSLITNLFFYYLRYLYGQAQQLSRLRVGCLHQVQTMGWRKLPKILRFLSRLVFWFSFYSRQILFMGLFFKVTPQLTICINYMPINYVCAKVHFCLVKYKYILTSQGLWSAPLPTKGAEWTKNPWQGKMYVKGLRILSPAYDSIG